MFRLDTEFRGTEPEESIADAVSALIYAAPRTEIKELQLLRELLMQKVGTLLPA
jgi:vacuolar protein sorting-associated protein IST1